MTADRPDWRTADEEGRRKFEQIQKFVSECRRHWPGSKIVIRASDAACVALNNPEPNQMSKEMQTTDFYSDTSKYLRASDLIGKELTPTIARVTSGEFTNDNGGKANKPVVEFKDLKQSLVLNKTNMGTMAAMFTSDMDRWAGQKVRLYADRVPFRGKMCDTIRVGRIKAAPAHEFDDAIDL
jgi:hypothetical protein